MQAIATFNVRGEDFYRQVEDFYGRANAAGASSPPQPSGGVNIGDAELCREGMTGLIARYNIRQKSVLSIGSGDGHEEYWLWKSQCRLTLVDNDVRYIEHVQNLPTAPAAGNAVNFCGADAGDFLSQAGNDVFDICYISSFHPDEKRREAIQEAFKLVRSSSDVANYVTWPEDEPPYSEVLMAAIKPLKPGGLIIFQHYCGGVDITYNPHYLQLVRQQFQSHGAELLEVYYFTKSPGIQLLVGMKGNAASAAAFLTGIQSNPEIKTFHGRYPHVEFKKDISKAFDLLRGGQIAS